MKEECNAVRDWIVAFTVCLGLCQLISPKLYAEEKLALTIGHSSPVTSIATSSSGNLVLTGSNDQTAILWDTSTGDQINHFIGHSDTISAVALSSDGTMALTGGKDRKAIIWDYISGKPKFSLESHSDDITSVAIAPGRNEVMTGSADGNAILWNAGNGTELWRFNTRAESVECVEFGVDGNLVAASTDDGRLMILDAKAGKLIWSRQFEQLNSEYTRYGTQRIRFSSGKEYVLVLNRLNFPSVWSLTTGERIFEGSFSVVDASFRGNQLILSGSVMSEIVDVKTGSRISASVWQNRTPGTSSDDSPSSISCLTPDGQSLFSIYKDTFYKWDVLRESRAVLKITPSGRVSGSLCLDVTKQGDRVAVGYANGEVAIWSAKSGVVTQRLRAYHARLKSVRFSEDGNLLLTTCAEISNNAATVWDANSGKRLYSLRPGEVNGLNVTINQAEFSPNGKTLLGQFVGSGYVFDARTGRLLWDSISSAFQCFTFDPIHGRLFVANNRLTEVNPSNREHGLLISDLDSTQVRKIKVSHDGSRICVNGDHRSFVWSLPEQSELHELRTDNADWDDIDFSPDGERLVTSITHYSFGQRAVQPHTVIRNASTGDVVANLKYLCFSDFSPDSKQAVLLGAWGVEWNKDAYLVSAADGSVQHILSGHTARVTDARYLPNSKILWTSSEDGSLIAWNTSTGEKIVRMFHRADSEDSVAICSDGFMVSTSSQSSLVRLSTTSQEQGRNLASYAMYRPDVIQNRLLGTPSVAAPTIAPSIVGGMQPIPSASSTSIEPNSPRLFVLAIGVENELSFPHSDATEVAKAFEGQAGLAYSTVITKVITNSDATPAGIRNGLAWLQNKCRDQDFAFVFFSGHGGQVGENLFYSAYRESRAHAVNPFYWHELASELGTDSLSSKQVMLFTDCCHAGSFGAGASSTTELYDVMKYAGIMVFASSKGEEYSYESGSWKHGAFTLALLEALEGKADFDHDKKVTLSEVIAFVTGRVKQLTNDRQHPFLPPGTFDPGLVLSHVR